MLLNIALILATSASTAAPSSMNNFVDLVGRTARGYLGEHYVYGDTGEHGFDCSSFVQAVFRQTGYSLPRTSREQVFLGEAVDFDNVHPGDLLFFTTEPGSHRITHVGIAIGANRMIHASRGQKKVVISNWDQPYYRSRWFAARRIR